MTRLSLSIAVAAALAAAGSAQAWPSLSGDIGAAECQQAYRLGVAAFNSTNAALAWPLEPPPRLGSTLAVYRTQKDISGGGALAADERIFETDAASDASRSTLYWQKAATGGRRLVVADTPFNWQGDWYSVFLLDADVRPAELRAQLDAKRVDERIFQPIMRNRWTPPLVLAGEKGGAVWLIDLGQFDSLADWRVYTLANGRAGVACQVAFHPPMKTQLALLPEPVRRFDAMLDEALGPGDNEGTLHPTATIRFDVGNAWMNASLRPWALVEPTYNSDEEVERGLSTWAAASRKRRALLDSLHRRRSEAEPALAAYYRSRFRLDPAEARRASAYVLDYMQRSYFVFGRDTPGAPAPAAPNPWPQRRR